MSLPRLLLGERDTLQQRAWTRRAYIHNQYNAIHVAAYRLEAILGMVPPAEVASCRLPVHQLRYVTDVLERCSIARLSAPRPSPHDPPAIAPIHPGILMSPNLPFLHQVRLFDRGSLSGPTHRGPRGFRDADWM